MAFSTPAVVTQVVGRAWIRNSDGSLTELHAGSRIPPDTEIVTASGATVALQTEGGMPLTIGENRDVAFNADMAGQPVDRSEAAVAAPTGTDSDRLLAALQNGQDPFDNLDPTAALVAGGGDAGGSSFVRLARVVEATTPLDLAYPGAGTPAINLLTPAGLATNNNAPANDPPAAGNDANTTTEKSFVAGNILTNDTDPNGDAVFIQSVGGRPMATGGVQVAGSTGGTFTVFPDGSYVFNPGDSYHNLGVGQTATSTLTYTISDPFGNTSTATVTVTVNGLNDAPTATAIDNVNGVDAQQNINVDVSSHFTDIDNGDKLTYSANGLPPGLTINPDTGVITGTIDHSASQGGNNGVYQVTITATDASGATVTETFNWNVSNPGPLAVNDAATTTEDAGVSGNVLTGNAQGAGRDIDPDGDTLTVVRAGDRDMTAEGVVVAGSAGGTFTIRADGSYSFNPGEDFQSLAAGETKTTTINYTISDGEGGTSIATLTLTVTGTNDVPVITPGGEPGPDSNRVQEDVILTTEGKLDIVDADHDQSFFQAQTGTAGQHGTFSIDAEGHWTYNLTNDDPQVQQLAVGEHLTETFIVKAADGTETTVTITIDGTNDIPTISGASTAAATEDVEQTVSGQLAVADIDTSDTHSWSVSGEPKGQYGTISVDQTGKWTYTVDQAATQALAAGQQVQETFHILVDDGNGGTAIQDVTVTITGTNDVPELSSGAGAVTEDQSVNNDGNLVTGGQLTITDPDAGESSFKPGAHFDSSTGNGNAPLGTLTFNADGSYTYSVANDNAAVQALRSGESIVETYTVTSADGSATSTITITINGTDDVPVITPHSPDSDKGEVQEDATLSTSGKLDIVDADHDQSFFQAQTNTVTAHGTFNIDANGNWTYNLNNSDPAVQELGAGQSLTEKITVLTADGTPTEVTITIDGTNDVPVLSSGAGVMTEDQNVDNAGNLVASGQLTVTDVDAGQSSFKPGAHFDGSTGNGNAPLGTLTFNADGSYHYSVANDNAAVQALRSGESIVETYTVTSLDGSATSTITITINGTDDVPVITPHSPDSDKGEVKEDATLSTGGKLDIIDADHDQSFFQAQTNTVTAHGTFNIDTNGNWTYNLNNSDPAVQELGKGESLTEKITVLAADGTPTEVTITIDGTNDTPEISGVATGAIKEDAAPSVSGQLAVSDVDVHDGHTWSVTGDPKGNYGTLTVDQTGKWTYTVDNAAVQALGEGQTKTETFTVQVDDGNGGTDTQTVTVVVTGTNDVPVVTGSDTGTVVEDWKFVATGDLDVKDADAGQSQFQPQLVTGAHGIFGILPDGHWGYTLNNFDPQVQALGKGETLTETFTVKTADGTPETVTITIVGTNDSPVISGVSSGALTEDAATTVTGQLNVSDVDVHDTHSWAVVGGDTRQYGSLAVDQTGKWTFTANDNVQGLSQGETVQQQFTVQVSDGKGGFDYQTVTITLTGTNDVPVLSAGTGAVTEDQNVGNDGNLMTSGQLTITDPDAGESSFKAGAHFDGSTGNGNAPLGTLTFKADGSYTYTVANDNPVVQGLKTGESIVETYTVTSLDGSKTSTITITINGTDDGAVITPHDPGTPGQPETASDHGTVTEDATPDTTSGKLDVKDADAGEAKFSTTPDHAGAHGTFTIDENGNWSYKLNNGDPAVQALGAGKTLTETFTVSSVDGSATHQVVVTIVGTNDVPVVSAGTGAVTEDQSAGNDGNLVTSGQLTITDVDAGESSFKPGAQFDGSTGNGNAPLGTLTFNADGSYSYTVANDNPVVQGLKTGESIVETYTVTSLDGSKTSTITITINGTDDGAVITPHDPGTPGQPETASDHGTVTEDATPDTTSGKLDVKDADAGEAKFSTTPDHAGAHGTFTIDENGNWSYKLNNGDPAVQALGAGKTLTETFTVSSVDGSATHQVVVTIVGTNDVPVVSAGTGAVTEDQSVGNDGNLVTSGQLTITDVDAGESSFKPGAQFDGSTGNGNAPLGTLTFNADGSYSYTVANDNPVVQGLKTGESIVETYTVTSLDGSKTSTITITINGTDDGAVITPHDPGTPGQPETASDHGTVTEDATPDTTSGKLDVKDADAGEAKFSTTPDHAGAHGTFTIDENGNWSYKLNNGDPAVQALGAGKTLTETFTVSSVDGSATHQVVVTIVGTNDVPVVSAGTGAVTEDQNVGNDGNLVTGGQLTITDVDAGESSFKPGAQFDGSTGNGNAPLGTLTFNADGSYTYTVANDNPVVQGLKTGQSIVETYTVTSLDGTKTSTVTITINGTDDAPKVVGHIDAQVGKDADTGINVDTASHFADVDAGDKLTYTANGLPPGLTIDKDTGKITGTIDHSASQGGTNHDGIYQVVVTATDTTGKTATQTFEWDVTNPAPKALDDVATVDGNGQASGNVILGDAGVGKDTDPDGDTLKVVSVKGNGNAQSVVEGQGTQVTGDHGGTFTLNANGSYTFNAGHDFDGLGQGETRTTSITYTVSDGEGGTDTATLTITVTGTNVLPVANDDTGATKQDIVLAVTDPAHGVLSNDTDGNPGDTLVVNSVNGNAGNVGQQIQGSNGGTFTLNANGTYTFNPGHTFDYLPNGQSTTTSITYTVSDGHGSSNT
uniref:retention module-containing protein n=1 Tax=Bordetella sputigena TaxID=1416810 RepID=UPI0039EE3DC9